MSYWMMFAAPALGGILLLALAYAFLVTDEAPVMLQAGMLLAGLAVLGYTQWDIYGRYLQLKPVDAPLRALLNEVPNNIVAMRLEVAVGTGTATCTRDVVTAKGEVLTDEVGISGTVLAIKGGDKGAFEAERDGRGWTFKNRIGTKLITPQELAKSVRACSQAPVVEPVALDASQRAQAAWDQFLAK